jgi:hypothetical protein
MNTYGGVDVQMHVILTSALVQIANKMGLKKFMSRLSRQCGILNITQPYRPPRPVTGIALLLLLLYPFFSDNCLFSLSVKRPL